MHPDHSSRVFTVPADGDTGLPLPRPETTRSSLTLSSCYAPHRLSGTPGSSILKRAPAPSHLSTLPTLPSVTWCVAAVSFWVSPPLSSVLASLHVFNTVARVILLKLQISVCHSCLKASFPWLLSPPRVRTWARYLASKALQDLLLVTS